MRDLCSGVAVCLAVSACAGENSVRNSGASSLDDAGAGASQSSGHASGGHAGSSAPGAGGAHAAGGSAAANGGAGSPGASGGAGGEATADAGAGGSTPPHVVDGEAPDAPTPSDATTPDAGATDAGLPRPDSGPPAPVCGQGVLTGSVSFTAENWVDADVWFGGGSNSDVDVHPRSVGQGVALEFPNDTLVETFGLSAIGPFVLVGERPVGHAVVVRAQVRDAAGAILSESSVDLPASFGGGFFDVTVSALVPKGVTRIFTMYVEGALESDLHTALEAQPYRTPVGTVYSAQVHSYAGQPPGHDSDFVTQWSPLWGPDRNTPIRFRYAGCQSACAALDCDDGNACTVDTCDQAAAACVHVPLECDDGVDCTVDSCDFATGCVNAPDASRCPDQPHCNSAKACSPGTGCGIDCSDDTICTADACNEATDRCEHAPASIPVGLSVDLDYDVLSLKCGEQSGDTGQYCILSPTGELSISDGGPTSSGCSSGRNASCCFLTSG